MAPQKCLDEKEEFLLEAPLKNIICISLYSACLEHAYSLKLPWPQQAWVRGKGTKFVSLLSIPASKICIKH